MQYNKRKFNEFKPPRPWQEIPSDDPSSESEEEVELDEDQLESKLEELNEKLDNLLKLLNSSTWTPLQPKA